MSAQNLSYFEDLVIEGCICPHEDSIHPDGEQAFYRIVKHNPATSDCFVSHRKKYPTREFSDECIARAVSTFNSIEGLFNAFIRTPAGRKKERLVATLVLTQTDGMLKQTAREGHYSWWRSRNFDFRLVNVQKVKP
ncbi:hypothetical protein [Flavilitoribacter nigricans]|uniref:hypothetical protein n=1 Tax=Flavilitoribacter nigricans TaxID=70997 RepID=UPI00117B2062|nr:hypothetical protein [Flavilitoribacter nigricans]